MSCAMVTPEQCFWMVTREELSWSEGAGSLKVRPRVAAAVEPLPGTRNVSARQADMDRFWRPRHIPG